MSPNYNKSYWRVDAEYQTLEHVINVSDKAPVGVWVPTIGYPYAYFETEDQAKEVFKSVLTAEVERLNKLIEGL